MLEGELAYQPHATDLRDLYLPGGGASRLTPRRLLVLIQALPRDARLWAVVAAEHEQALTSVERLRARQALYAQKGGSDD